VVKASEILPDIPHWGGGYTPVALQQEIQGLANPVAPFGSAIVGTVEDLQAQTQLKVQRARQAVGTTMDLLGNDLLEAAFWLDVRIVQNAQRKFGAAPTAVWSALRKLVPLRSDPNRTTGDSDERLAAHYVHVTDPSTFDPAVLPSDLQNQNAAQSGRCGTAPHPRLQ